MKRTALLTLWPSEKKGFLFRPKVLDRVAPFFFAPHLRGELTVAEIGTSSLKLMIALGYNNWQSLDDGVKMNYADKVNQLCGRNDITELGVSRFLDSTLFAGNNGERFLGAMILVWAKKQLQKSKPRRVVIVSEHMPDPELILCLAELGLPVVWQNRRPDRNEADAMNLLYRQGVPVSLASFQPQRWEERDLIVFRDDWYAVWGKKYDRGHWLDASNESRGHAPALEEALRRQGIAPGLHNLAPLLEVNLTAKADDDSLSIKEIEYLGTDIWPCFLDNKMGGHYNTVKGFCGF